MLNFKGEKIFCLNHNLYLKAKFDSKGGGGIRNLKLGKLKKKSLHNIFFLKPIER